MDLIMLSAPFISPTNTSILKITSPRYFHTIVTVVKPLSGAGALALAYAENMRHARITTAPSKHTPIYDLIKDLPTCDYLRQPVHYGYVVHHDHERVRQIL